MSGIGLAYKTPEQESAQDFDASARAVTQPPAGSGIGLASNASLPPGWDSAEIDPNLSPAIPGVVDATGRPVAPVQTAELSDITPAASATAAPAAPRKKPLIDFKQNPLGAIGLVLESAVAGFQGKESPVERLQAQQLEQTAQQYKTAELALNIVDKTSRYVAKLPAGQRAAAIKDLDSRFSGALGGNSIGGILTAFSAGSDAQTAARLDALKALNPSPAMLAYWSSDPEAATKALDSYNQHQLTKETPEEAGAKAGAVARATNAAGADKPMTPAEIEANKISKKNADTSAAALAETKTQHGIENANAQNKPLTADQANSATFADRAHAAEAVLTHVQKQGSNFFGRAKESLGANVVQSDDYQQFEQARRNFINAVLRKESGAAIAPSEFDSADKQYFPQPGDGQKVIEQKAETRRQAISGLARSAGNKYSLPDPLGLRK